MQKVEIVYASTSGNTELVCEKISQELLAAGLDCELHRAEVTDISVFESSRYYVLASSTWEHGELNPNFNELHSKMQKYDFSGKFAAFVGLGDIRYEPMMFAKAIDILKDAFLHNGGKEMNAALKINGEPHTLLETSVKTWALKYIEFIISNEST